MEKIMRKRKVEKYKSIHRTTGKPVIEDWEDDYIININVKKQKCYGCGKRVDILYDGLCSECMKKKKKLLKK